MTSDQTAINQTDLSEPAYNPVNRDLAQLNHEAALAKESFGFSWRAIWLGNERKLTPASARPY